MPRARATLPGPSANSIGTPIKLEPDNQSSWTYDAVTVLAKAINAAGKTDPQAIREALLALKGQTGAEGTYAFDANGDGLHGYNVVQNDKGRMSFTKRVDFQD